MAAQETGGGRNDREYALARIRRFLARGDMRLDMVGSMDAAWYRPGEFLVHRDDVQRLTPALESWEAERVAGTEQPEQPEQYGPVAPAPLDVAAVEELLDLAVFRVDERVDIPALARCLRISLDGPTPRISPIAIMFATQLDHWGTDLAVPASPDDLPTQQDTSLGEGLRALVLDTGFVDLDWFAGRVDGDPDPLDVDPADDLLDDEAGHGTFIAGRILQAAPGATVTVHRILDTAGVGHEVDLALDITRRGHEGDALVLCVGSYSSDDVPPLALTQALQGLDRKVVVVAAAGNYGRQRPVWPAAFKGVIAVGALARAGGARASFSNLGHWVDAAAPGVDVLSSFPGFDERPGGGTRVFAGAARWSGTSFAAPHVAGRILAEASRRGIPPAEAAWQLVFQPGAPQASDPGLGTEVA